VRGCLANMTFGWQAVLNKEVIGLEIDINTKLKHKIQKLTATTHNHPRF